MKRQRTPAAAKPNLAVGYVRVAACPPEGPRQRLDAQTATVRAAAAAHGIEIVRIFEDAGESAHNAQRPGLLALLAAIDGGGVDAIIVPDLTRLARDADDLRRLLAFLDGRGVRLFSAAGGV